MLPTPLRQPKRLLQNLFYAVNDERTLCIMCGDGAKGDVHRAKCGHTLYTPPGSGLGFTYADQNTDTCWNHAAMYCAVKRITRIQIIGHTNCGWAKVHDIDTPRQFELLNQTAQTMAIRFEVGVDIWIVDDAQTLNAKTGGFGSFFSRSERARVVSVGSVNPPSVVPAQSAA